MPDHTSHPSLPERLRAIATEQGFDRVLERAPALGDPVEACTEAADELERLAELPELIAGVADDVEAERVTPAAAALALRMRAERLRAVLGLMLAGPVLRAVLERAAFPAYVRSPDGSIRRADLDGPPLRYVVTPWGELDGEPPAGGAFVQCGPARATWRVHGMPRLEAGGRLAILEPVDPHVVPLAARVVELPMPLLDVTDEPEDSPLRRVADGEPESLALCSARMALEGWNGASRTVQTIVCERIDTHPGEHLGAGGGREVAWQDGNVGAKPAGEPRLVPRGSLEARAALDREGIRHGIATLDPEGNRR